MNKAYSRINWINKPSTRTPINDVNLNREDLALNTIDDRVIELYNTKAEQSDLLGVIRSVTYDTTTGIWTFTHVNGTTQEFDQNIEKIPVSFSMDENGIITMETTDGTEYTADVGSLIKTYTFDDSDTIDFTTTTNADGDKTVTADIINGSITADKLQPNYLADIQAEVTTAESYVDSIATSAQTAAADALLAESHNHGNTGVRDNEDTDNAQYYKNQAGDSATLSESWAVGGTNTRTGEDTNNAKYWAEVAAGAAAGGVSSFNGRSGIVTPQSGDYTPDMVGVGTATTTDTGLVKPDGTSVTIDNDGTIHAQSGHAILNSAGVAVDQKSKLQFLKSTVVNDGDKTVVTPAGGVSAVEPGTPAASTPIIDVATTTRAGVVKPDGTTITVDGDGTIHGSSQPEYEGTTGQVLGFTADNVVGAMDIPDSGVTTFNGRTGAVTPQSGDYTAAMVGALPTQIGTQGQVLGFTANNTIGAMNIPSPDLTAYLKKDGTVAADYLTVGTRNGTVGKNAFTNGGSVTASGDFSHAEGINGVASGRGSHVEGASGQASQQYAHAEGVYTVASGQSSHAEGEYTTASGTSSHASGSNTVASSYYTYAGGLYTKAGYTAQTVIGKYNNNKSTSLFEIGKGTSEDNRSNAMEVDSFGNVNITGDYKRNGNIIGYTESNYAVFDIPTTGGRYVETTQTLTKGIWMLIGMVGDLYMYSVTTWDGKLRFYKNNGASLMPAATTEVGFNYTQGVFPAQIVLICYVPNDTTTVTLKCQTIHFATSSSSKSQMTLEISQTRIA